MTSTPECPQCGKPLPADAPGGLCPRCLVGQSLTTDTKVLGSTEQHREAITKPPSDEAQALAEVARLFPQFEILRCLGQGGMGLVYQARQPRLDRIVALKMVAKAMEGDAYFAERFGREARTLARLSHPNIVTVYDFGDVHGHYYLLIEYVDGMNLREALQKGKITREWALEIVPEICKALQYAHGRGVVHRDIKPENILLDKQGQVKIADFGIAKLVERKAKDSTLTGEKQVIGTPHYMAPEQVETPQNVDHRADIYSLGVVFCEMLTGQLPLGKFAPPSRKAAVDTRLDEVVLRALEREPKDRYQQASELQQDVESIALGDHHAGGSGPTAKPVRSRAHGLRQWGLAAGIVLGAAALLVLFREQFTWWRSQWPPFSAGTENVVFPADAGVVDVTKPPYNAKPDGQTDVTAALQQALMDFRGKHAIIYLPKGIYLVSDTLRWGEGPADEAGHKRMTLQGQGSDSTIIRLKDACPRFANPKDPQPLVSTGPKGEDRYFNSVRNLTVDTGRGNPGAIGVQFCANFVGCVRDVAIRSGDGQGVTGLDMALATGSDATGPLLVKNLSVRGFEVGIHTKGVLLSQTFEHIWLEDQTQVAFLNEGQAVSIRDLNCRGRVPAFRNEASIGLAVILDSKFQGSRGAQTHAAILNRPGLFVRNLAVAGFAHAIAHNGAGETNVPGPFVREWASQLFPNSRPSLNLPVKETPEVPWGPATEWANPVTFGASPDSGADSSDAIQRAIDSGKRTIYLPRGEYAIRHPIQLRGKVRRLVGCEAVLHLTPVDERQPALMLADGDAPAVVLERLQIEFHGTGTTHRFVDNPSRRTLVLRDCGGAESEFTGPGEIFLENVGGKMIFHGQTVWARQVNQTTHDQMPREQWWHLRNEGGRLWILGEMTAGPGPIVIQSQGGQTEVLGGLAYSSGGTQAQPEPAFLLDYGALSVSFNEVSHGSVTYPVLVRRLRQGEQRDLLMPDQAHGGVNASLVPQFGTD